MPCKYLASCDSWNKQSNKIFELCNKYFQDENWNLNYQKKLKINAFIIYTLIFYTRSVYQKDDFVLPRECGAGDVLASKLEMDPKMK